MAENVVAFIFCYLYCLLYYNIAFKIAELFHWWFKLVKNKKEKAERKEKEKSDWKKNKRFCLKIIFAILLYKTCKN